MMCGTLPFLSYRGSMHARLPCLHRLFFLILCILYLSGVINHTSSIVTTAAAAAEPASPEVDIDERIRNAAEDDLYAVLGLSVDREDATERQVKTAWRQLSKKYHPDLAGGEAVRPIYQRIQRAYEILGDRRKRKMYDILGLDGVKKMEQSQTTGQQNQAAAMNPFFQFFGGAAQASDRGEDVTLLLHLPLQDVYRGAAHRMHFAKNRICRACRGSGAKSPAHIKPCIHCNGQGTLRRQVQIVPGFVQTMEQPCPHCNGAGKLITAHCPVCAGKGVTREQAHISLDIESGVPEGTELRYEMEADQKPGKVPGDIVLQVTTVPHPVFTRNGNDLHMEVELTLKEALVGFAKTLTHMDGHDVELSYDSVTQWGTKRTEVGEGMPRHHVPSERGDLIVTYKVKLPTRLTEQQRNAWKAAFFQS